MIVEKPFGRDLSLGARAQRCRAQRLPGGFDLPHRSLPRQGGDHEHPLLPLRQFVPRADLEPQLCRERPGDTGRGFRRQGPRRLLRDRRLPARRDREPPVPDRRAARDGAARRPRLWRRAGREGQGVPRDAPARSRRRGARAICRLPRRARRGEGLRRRDVLRAEAVHRLLAMAGGAVVPALGQISCRRPSPKCWSK